MEFTAGIVEAEPLAGIKRPHASQKRKDNSVPSHSRPFVLSHLRDDKRVKAVKLYLTVVVRTI